MNETAGEGVPTRTALHDDDTGSAGVEVFRGPRAACFEYGLVLDAAGLGPGYRYDPIESNGSWVLLVAPALQEVATEELRRYAAERRERRAAPETFVPFAGSGIGSGVYAVILILVAYCAGVSSGGVDWLSAGELESGAGADWWRPVTALTLHLDQEHLMGNLLFGIGIGTLAGRIFGPGIAWLSILLSGAFGNAIDMMVAPAGHRAVGASTAVFAALGLLAGFGWGQIPTAPDRRFYRWTPVFGGICLLVLLGTGGAAQHVDVLGHLLGFTAGIAMGWAFARCGMPHRTTRTTQWFGAVAAVMLIAVAWTAALHTHPRPGGT